jgi:glutaredoxin
MEVQEDVEIAQKKEEATTSSDDSPKTHVNLIKVTSLDSSDGDTLPEKIDSFIQANSVVMISKSWCPFCTDAKEFLSQRCAVKVHYLDIDHMSEGSKILDHVYTKTGHKSVPLIYIKGEFVGGCAEVKALQEKGELEKRIFDLVQGQRTKGTDRFETSHLVAVHRSTARNPLFWFPNTVNNIVVRLTGLQVFGISVISCAFFKELWARYLAAFLVIDFMLRLTVGSFLSPLGIIATFLATPFEPDFRPGPPKQFAAFCGVMFSTLATLFYFWDFEYHEIVGAIWIGMLAGAAGLEAFFDYCLGCVFFGLGIQFGVLPDDCYRIYTQTRQETVDSYHYKMNPSLAPQPELVDTDPGSPIALKYKKKNDEWTKDDFHWVRNMQGMFVLCGGFVPIVLSQANKD